MNDFLCTTHNTARKCFSRQQTIPSPPMSFANLLYSSLFLSTNILNDNCLCFLLIFLPIIIINQKHNSQLVNDVGDTFTKPSLIANSTNYAPTIRPLRTDNLQSWHLNFCLGFSLPTTLGFYQVVGVYFMRNCPKQFALRISFIYVKAFAWCLLSISKFVCLARCLY